MKTRTFTPEAATLVVVMYAAIVLGVFYISYM